MLQRFSSGRVGRGHSYFYIGPTWLKCDAAVSTVAAQLGVAWWTVMDQVIEPWHPAGRGSDPAHTAEGPVEAVGVDETAYLRANATRSTTFATGIADLSPGRPARLLDVVEGRSGSVLADWLADQPAVWRTAVATASLDPFRGSVGHCHRPEQPASAGSAGA
jgi:hypothetical protein